MGRSLPDRPNLEQLRKQAKDLLKAHKQGDASACPILRHLSRFSAASDEDILKAKLVLSEAQHALAREYGFKNWAALARGVAKGPPPRQPDSLQKVVVVNVEKSGGIQGAIMRAGMERQCESCDEPATVHVTNRIGGRRVEEHYCAKHAEENVSVLVGKHKLDFHTYPVKYVVTVSLTQDQLDREEVVPVTLPDGSAMQSPFGRDSKEGYAALLGPKPGAAEKYCVRFVLRIVPPAGPE